MGARISFFDAVAVGDAPRPVAPALTRTDLVRYAGGCGDVNPMHHDEVAAPTAALRSCRVRFTRQTWPGETNIQGEAVAPL